MEEEDEELGIENAEEVGEAELARDVVQESPG